MSEGSPLGYTDDADLLFNHKGAKGAEGAQGGWVPVRLLQKVSQQIPSSILGDTLVSQGIPFSITGDTFWRMTFTQMM